MKELKNEEFEDEAIGNMLMCQFGNETIRQ